MALAALLDFAGGERVPHGTTWMVFISSCLNLLENIKPCLTHTGMQKWCACLVMPLLKSLIFKLQPMLLQKLFNSHYASLCIFMLFLYKIEQLDS